MGRRMGEGKQRAKKVKRESRKRKEKSREEQEPHLSRIAAAAEKRKKRAAPSFPPPSLPSATNSLAPLRISKQKTRSFIPVFSFYSLSSTGLPVLPSGDSGGGNGRLQRRLRRLRNLRRPRARHLLPARLLLGLRPRWRRRKLPLDRLVPRDRHGERRGGEGAGLRRGRGAARDQN